MKYIIDMPEIKRCVDCDFDSYEDGKHFCSIEQSINLREINTIENIHKDCPLKPLKVKELEWITEIRRLNEKYHKSGIYLIAEFSDNNYALYLPAELPISVKTLDEAKEFCQQHYEKMILSALED